MNRLLFLLLLTGCRGDKDGTDEHPGDIDADGYTVEEGDCEDADPAIFPGAPDAGYDGIDSDCAGNDDYDLDGDGYVPEGVDPADQTDDLDDFEHLGSGDCWDDPDEVPIGFTAINGFSQPTAADVNPGAENVYYDGIDQACAGDSLNDFDADGDGHETTEYPDALGYRGGDCDDANASTNPNSPEVCDELDNDCDELVDDEDDDLDPGAGGLWYLDTDGDTYGDPATEVATCVQPEGYIADGTDCDDSDAEVLPGGDEECDNADNNCDGSVDEGVTTTYYLDNDSDGFGLDYVPTEACNPPVGYAQVSGDCDDTTAATNPDELEYCDDADNDCDGSVDEEPEDGDTFYADDDGDGYGDASDAEIACEAPAGHVADDADCDDADAAVSPDATEYCGGVDEDCDGLEDDEDPSLAYSYTWLADDDGDGFGDDNDATIDCDAPPGTTPFGGDCDDSDAGINPDSSEIAGDEIDQDCDDAETCYADDDSDGYRTGATVVSADADCADAGEALASDPDDDCDDADDETNPGADEVAGDEIDQDCDGGELCYADDDSDGHRPNATATTASADDDCADAGEALASDPDDDCDDDEATIHPDQDEICDDGLEDNDCDASTDCRLEDFGLADADHSWTGENRDDYAGSAVNATGDLDGDGIDDALIGASGELAFYVEEGPIGGGTTDLGTLTKLTGASGSNVGASLASGADADGDGIDDVLAGAYGLSSSSGGAYFLAGPVASSGALSSVADSAIASTSTNSNLGFSVALAGDLSGDGLGDLVIGANRDDLSGNANSGAVYLLHGPPAAAPSLPADADATLYGVSAYDVAGNAVAVVWDADGDGVDELAVGAYGQSSVASFAGAVYVVSGPIAGTSSLADADAILTGASTNAYAGFSLAGDGDADGDGYGDLLVGAYGASTAYLLRGPFTDGSLAGADAVLVGTSGSNFSLSLSLAGDLDGDGRSDALVGANRDSAAASLAGAAYLYYGPLDGSISSADAVFTGETSSDQAGYALSAGDVDGDGTHDALIGAWKTGSYNNTGTAYLIFGVAE